MDRALTKVIGYSLVLYGAWVLVRVTGALGSPILASPVRVEGLLAWLWNAGQPWRDWFLAALHWLVAAAFVVGGFGVILRRVGGIRVAVAGLVVAVVVRLLYLPLSVSLALGLATLHSDYPPTRRFAGAPAAEQHYIWWWSVGIGLVELLVLLGALLWLRRVLAEWHR